MPSVPSNGETNATLWKGVASSVGYATEQMVERRKYAVSLQKRRHYFKTVNSVADLPSR